MRLNDSYKNDVPKIYIYVCVCVYFCLFAFYGTSSFVGYSMPNQVLYIQTVLFQTIQFSMSTQFNCQKHFYFKLSSLVKHFLFKQFCLVFV